MDQDVDRPYVTVLMPVYNAEPFLREAIDSILNQTWRDFEFLIINDGSTDNSVQIIESYEDPRIVLIHNKENLGLTRSLNLGLKLSRGKYIARMDADDISVPERLKVQVEFMDNNPDIAVAGSWFYLMQKDYILQMPVDPEITRILILFRNVIGHPTVMMRKDFFIANDLYYNENYSTSQDHELWYRVLKIGKITNIPEVLLKYRLHNDQVSTHMKSEQLRNSRAIQESKLMDFTGLERRELPSYHFQLINDQLDILENEQTEKLLEWYDILKKINDKKNIYDNKKFDQYIATLARRAVNLSSDFNGKLIRKYKSTHLANSVNDRLFDFKLIVKSIIKYKRAV